MQTGSAQLLLIVAAVIVILSGVYFYQHPKKDPQVSLVVPLSQSIFKDYSNKLGFQLKYPKDMVLKEDSEEEFNKRGGGDFRKNFKGYVQYDPGKFLAAVLILNKDNNFDMNPFTLWVFDNPNDLSIEEWYKNYWYYPFVWGDFTYTGKVELAPKLEATIFGQIAKSGIINYQPGKPKFIYSSKDKKMYLFKIIDDPKKIGEQILSTFEFLNVQTVSDEKQQIDQWIKKNNLNQYGDPKDIVYPGGTPLFNEMTGQSIDRYDYILKKYPDKPWKK